MLVTRVGKIALRVPQDRQGRFRTKCFEGYQRSEKALVAAIMEIYLHGVSTRKVKMITEELCGHEFSSSTISRIVQQLDERAGQVFCAAAIGRNRIRIVLTASPGWGCFSWRFQRQMRGPFYTDIDNIGAILRDRPAAGCSSC